MKIERILFFAATALSIAGCPSPKVEKYRFTPPALPNPSPSPFNKDFEEKLKEALKFSQCKEAKPISLKLAGHWDIAKVKVPAGTEVPQGEARPASFKTPDGQKAQLIHNGCPADLVEREAAGLDVVLLDRSKEGPSPVTSILAEKVLLCGPLPATSMLMVAAKTVLLKDFEYTASAFLGSISLETGELILEGANKMTAVSTSGALEFNIDQFIVQIETGMSGTGTLELDSKVVSCKEVAEKKKEKEKAKERQGNKSKE